MIFYSFLCWYCVLVPFVTSFPSSLPLGRMTKVLCATATHKDFIHLHGMLCQPITAHRCIKAFDGTILFMPSTYKEKGIVNYHAKNLNLLTYYVLVLWTSTGLSTFFRQTDFIETKEDLSKGLISPEITEDIITYINQESGGSEKRLFKVIRRYAFHFRLCNLRVKMFHLQSSDDDKLHLVEIYEPIKISQFLPPLLIAVSAVVIGYFVSFSLLFKTFG